MSISSGDWLILSLGAALLLIAWAIGVFRARSILGPDRCRGESIVALAGIAAAGWTAWQLVPILFALPFMTAPTTALASAPTSAPASQPAALNLTPMQTVSLGILGASLGLVTLVGGNLLARPGGLRRIGLGPEKLPAGILAGVLGAIVVIPITLAATLATDLLYQRLHVQHPEAHELLLILGGADRPDLRAMVLISATILAPVFEEIFFRGHVQTLLAHAVGRMFRPSDLLLGAPVPAQAPSAAARWIAVVVTSLVFALVHTPWMIPPIFVLSLGLGYAYERTGNLWTPIVMHALFNILNVSVFVYISPPH